MAISLTKSKGRVFLQDDCCHWYLIPDIYVTKFSILVDKIEQDNKAEMAASELEEKFNKYRIDGSPSNYLITACEVIR